MADRRSRDVHAWFRARLAAHDAELLDDEDARRFEAHAQECAECGSAMSTFAEPRAADAHTGEHIPARLLARWPETRRTLRGLPRRLVREHLRQCAECRADLVAIGHDAVLEADPALEEATGHPRVVRGGDIGGTLKPWIAGGAVGAVLATAATLIVVTVWAPRSVDMVSVPPSGTAATMARPSPFVADVLPPVIALREPLRGTAVSETTLRIQPGTRYVHVLLPELFVSDTATVSIHIVGPLGDEQAAVLRRYEELSRRRTLLLGSPDRPLEAGHYRIAIATPFSTELPAMEMGLTLTR